MRSGDQPTGRVICIAYKRPRDLSSSETEQTSIVAMECQ